MAGTDYQNLDVWRRSVGLVVNLYKLTKGLPKNEDYGLKSQMQRAGISIPSNIAEGYRRGSKDEFRRFLHIAVGSAAELETQLIITNQVYGAKVNLLVVELVEIQKMLHGLIKKL